MEKFVFECISEVKSEKYLKKSKIIKFQSVIISVTCDYKDALRYVFLLPKAITITYTSTIYHSQSQVCLHITYFMHRSSEEVAILFEKLIICQAIITSLQL